MFESNELPVAQQAARQAGQLLMSYFGKSYPVSHKSSYNLVSEPDLKSEALITACIREHFPTHAILAEESNHQHSDSEHLWIVDPLDGTNNFVHGIPHFAVSVAYYRNGQPELGLVHQPSTGDWFVAGKSQGAWVNGQPAHVTESASLKEVLVGVGFYYDRGKQMRATLGTLEKLFEAQIHGIRRMGTASLDLCQVGCGQFGAYFEFELAPWDFAAGALFVTEAGGSVSQCDGNVLLVEKSSVLATNGNLHRDALQIIRPLFEGLGQRD